MRKWKIRAALVIIMPALVSSLIVTYAAVSPTTMLPIVVKQPGAVTLTTVLECSCGFSNSTVGPDGKIYTIAQRFDRGGKLFVYVFDGSVLREVADPGMVGPIPADSNTPSFGLPVQKNGPGSIFFTSPPNSRLVVIAPARPVGVTEGNYNLMMYSAPLSDIKPEP